MECKSAGISVRLQEGSNVRIEYPVPPEFEQYRLICDHSDQALEYYLLARYAYLHKMSRSFMINSFWAVEHFILSALIPKYDLKGKDDLRKFGGYHQIFKYWTALKKSALPEVALGLGRFDGYIATVQGYFLERYPTVRAGMVYLFMGERPQFSFVDEPARRVKFVKDAPLNLRDLDGFANLMIRSNFPSDLECRSHLMIFLDMFESRNLYCEDNQHSLIQLR